MKTGCLASAGTSLKVCTQLCAFVNMPEYLSLSCGNMFLYDPTTELHNCIDTNITITIYVYRWIPGIQIVRETWGRKLQAHSYHRWCCWWIEFRFSNHKHGSHPFEACRCKPSCWVHSMPCLAFAIVNVCFCHSMPFPLTGIYDHRRRSFSLLDSVCVWPVLNKTNGTRERPRPRLLL